MKKVLTSVLALLMAAMMVITFASCGGNDEPETTTQAPVVESTEDVNAPVEESSAAEADTSAAEAESTEAPAVEESSAAAEDATAEDASSEAEEVAVPTEKADIVALYNEATAKAKSAKAGYKKTVTTKLNNLEMGLLASIDMVRETVGEFLGEGTETVAVKKGTASDELIKSTLTASDVTAATCKLSADGKFYEVTITVKNETNPLKGKSALNRYTNDYKDINEMRDGLVDAGAEVGTIDIQVKTATIKAKIAVDTKAFSSIDYTISSDANLTKVKYSIASVKVVTGNIYTTVKYTGFSY